MSRLAPALTRVLCVLAAMSATAGAQRVTVDRGQAHTQVPDTAAVGFARRIAAFADSAALALEFVPDSDAAKFHAALALAELNQDLKRVGLAPSTMKTPIPYRYETLSDRARRGAKIAGPFIDAIEAYHAPAGMDRMQDQMTAALRASALSADSIARQSIACDIILDRCARGPLNGLLGRLRDHLAEYYAARNRAAQTLSDRHVELP